MTQWKAPEQVRDECSFFKNVFGLTLSFIILNFIIIRVQVVVGSRFKSRSRNAVVKEHLDARVRGHRSDPEGVNQHREVDEHQDEVHRIP